MADKVFMQGNEVVAEAAVRAGCRFFSGYPITPQNEIPEYLSWRLPEVGGVFVQGESEVAAINMVYGASAAGVRSMTTSSSPGISLKCEGISYLSSTKLPALIVNISRGGPGLGTIQPAQQDYLQATKAMGHGGFRLMVFAPAYLQELADITYKAFDYSERDRNPVLILMDGSMGKIMEQVELPPMREDSDEGTEKWNLSRKADKPRGARMLTPIYPEIVLENENKQHALLIKRWEEEDVMVEEFMLEDAEFVCVAYGTSARVVKEVVLKLRDEGHKVGMIRPITLFPFPKKSFKNLNYNQVKGIIDIEMAIPAQMRDDIELAVCGGAPVFEYGRSGGMMIDDEGVYDAVIKVIGGVNNG